MEQAIADLLPQSESLAWGFFARVPCAELDELKSITAEALVQAASRWVEPYCSSRGYWPWDEDDSSKPERHWPGFAIKRMKGALLDWARSQDRGVTRTQRRAVRAMDAASADGIRGEQEQAAAAGVSVAKAREARAAAALTTVSLDDTFVSLDRGSSPMSAPAPSSRSPSGRRWRRRWPLRFPPGHPAGYAGTAIPPGAAPGAWRPRACILEPAEARRQLEAAVCEIHQALLRQCRTRAPGRAGRPRRCLPSTSAPPTPAMRRRPGPG